MARVEILKNVSINTGVKLQREASIKDSTLALIDMRSKWGGASKDLVSGNTIKNLAYFDNSATVDGTGTLTYSNKGLKFTEGSGKLRINLADDMCPKFTSKKYLVQFCVKLDKYAVASSGNNQLINIGSGIGDAAANSMLSIRPVSNADQLTISAVNCFIHGCTMQVNNINASTTELSKFTEAFKAGNNKLLHVGISVEVGATNTTVKVFLNGELAYTRTPTNATTSITNTNKNLNANSGYPAHIAGTYYRYRFDDLSITGSLTDSEVVDLEYAQCKANFT